MKKVRQHDVKDCGAACLATILRYYKSFISIIEIREYMHVDKNGANIFALCQTAEHFGMVSDAYEGTLEEIQQSIINKELDLPLVAHIVVDNTMLHFIVIKKISNTHIYIFDPIEGDRKYKHSEFKNIFTGYFVTFAPSDDFVPVRKTLKSYNKFLNIIAIQKKLFLSAICLSSLLAGLSILCSFSFQTIIDKFILNNRSETITGVPFFSTIYLYMEKASATLPALIIAILCVYIVQSALFALRGVIITYIYRNSSQLLISEYCNTLIKLPIPFFHDRETGEILSRYNDIEEIQNIISGIGLSIIMDLVMAAAGAFVLYSISQELFIVVLIMTITYALIAFCYRHPIRKISGEIMEADSKVMSKLKEVIEGIESIKASSAEEKIRQDLQKKIRRYIDKSKRGSLLSVSQSTLLQLSESVGGIVVLWIGCNYITNGVLTLGTFISFQTLMYFFISPIQNLLSMQIVLQQAFVSADRLNDVLENKTEEELLQGTEKMKITRDPHIRVENLSFAYGFREPILKGITFQARGSEKIAVLGKSGCGKTTLFHILSRLEDGYQGRITIDGEDIKSFNTESYRENIIFIPQESTLFADSFRENILMGKSIDEQVLCKIVKGCELDDLIFSYDAGLDAVIEENGKNLSGGQKQRIAIARALVGNPYVLLLDESTSHIDPETESKIFQFITKEFRDAICFFSTHKESTIDLCDRKLYIEDGYLVN